MTEEDILFRVKLDLLQTKLTQKVTKDKGKIRDEDIEDYYEKNKKRFAQPERRDLNVVLTKTEAKAEKAKAELEDGESFKAVAKKYSIDQASKAQGGKLPGRGQGPAGEGPRQGRLRGRRRARSQGPVKTQFGYYVFEVTKSRRPRSSRSSRPRRRSGTCCAPSASRRRWTTFVKDFREKYKDKTDCAEDYRVGRVQERAEATQHRGRASGRRARSGAAAGRAAGRCPAGRCAQGAAPQGARRRRSPQQRARSGRAAGPAGRHAAAPSAAAPAADGAPQPSGGARPAEALARLDEITRRLRRECPWDREQDERSIVPHTVEEAYELADAAHSGDDAKLVDELGDVLFQVYFLSLLLEERGAGGLAAVADQLPREADPPPPARVRRREAEDAAEVRAQLGRRSSAARSAAARSSASCPRRCPAHAATRQEGAAQAAPRGGRRRRMRAAASGSERAERTRERRFEPSASCCSPRSPSRAERGRPGAGARRGRRPLPRTGRTRGAR